LALPKKFFPPQIESVVKSIEECKSDFVVIWFRKGIVRQKQIIPLITRRGGSEPIPLGKLKKNGIR
jgi:hypothetical protein